VRVAVPRPSSLGSTGVALFGRPSMCPACAAGAGLSPEHGSDAAAPGAQLWEQGPWLAEKAGVPR